jgi:hypothetical protein
MMVATDKLSILRINWNGNEERDYSLDLKRIPFSINQQVHYAVPITDKDAYVVSMDYSPLVAGFAVVLQDGRAAFLSSYNLKFDPNVSVIHKIRKYPTTYICTITASQWHMGDRFGRCSLYSY